MSGTPNETEVQTQWRNVVKLLEDTRAHADGTVAGDGNNLDTIYQSLYGEYTPGGLTAAGENFRAGLSALADPSTAREFLDPILLEYSKLLTNDSEFTDPDRIISALYDHFISNSLTVESRAITFDTSQTFVGAGGGSATGPLSRLTVDESGYAIENATVEKKTFVCTQDQNSGVNEWAEIFECRSDAASKDSLLRSSYGSGEASLQRIVSRHAGTGSGGSLLRNSSFSTYTDGATQEFSGWTASGAGAANIDQDTTNYYRSFPNASTDASLEITGGDDITLTQTLSDMRIGQLNPDRPYFLRVMLNKTVGSAVGGTVTIACGSKTAAITIASLGANWQELRIGDSTLAGSEAETDQWFKNFNEDGFDITITWASSTSGTLLVDDVIFCEYDQIDGTYWNLRHNLASPAPWIVDDSITYTDTGGAPATAKIQWWLWVAYNRYLPNTSLGTSVPTFTEPS